MHFLFGSVFHYLECAQQTCSQVISSMRQMAIRSPKPDSSTSSDSDENCDGACSPSPPADVSSSQTPPSQSLPSDTQKRARMGQDTVPLFTMRQVTALCDRLIREREEQLREEYDNILCCKLAGEILMFAIALLCFSYHYFFSFSRTICSLTKIQSGSIES